MTTATWEEDRPECPECGERIEQSSDHGECIPDYEQLGKQGLAEHLHYRRHS